MKNIQFKIYITGLLVAGLLLSVQANSQTRKLPDGTIVYPDGTRRLPNGTIIYKDGANDYPRNDRSSGGVTLPDGRVVYPDGDDRYPDRTGRYPDRTDRYPDDRRRRDDDDRNYRRDRKKWLPPGQAKKIYGGKAKDYAPGHQKKWKGHGKKHKH